ncbi:cation acetate symporter [Streptacidiphilus sp. MAP5-3]|uniref:sodium/solute symporter n=1 Tax=unclassified Streptacidiphilus TaxID=2643834 RepID=UPI00351936D8
MNVPVPNTGVPSGVLISFLIVVGLSILLCVLFGSDSDQVADFYTANRTLTPLQNGLALAGDYVSATTMLGMTGLVALAGYDGFALSVSIVLSMGVLMLLAQAMRNAGRYTFGDILELRAAGPAPRIAAAVATLAASLPFLVVQLSGAGSTTALFLGHTDAGTQKLCTALIGVLMVCFAVLGGMRGIGILQIVKVPLVLGVMLVVLLSVFSHFHWSLNALLRAAGDGSGPSPYPYLRPGREFGNSLNGRLDFVGVQVTVALSAFMPHMIMRVSCAPNGIAARRSARRAISMVGALMLGVVLLGMAEAAMVGGLTIAAVNPNGQSALLLLSRTLNGGIGTTAGNALFTVVASTVFVAVLAAVADVTLAAAAGLAHDLAAHAFKRGTMSEAREVRATQWSAVAVGLLGIGLAVTALGYNVNFLTVFALAMAASTIFPALVYSLFWPRYNRAGLLWTVYGGLACTVGLQLFSPTISGSASSLFPQVDFHFFPLQTPGLISVPVAFLLGWAASVRGKGTPTGVEPPRGPDAALLLGAQQNPGADRGSA